MLLGYVSNDGVLQQLKWITVSFDTMTGTIKERKIYCYSLVSSAPFSFTSPQLALSVFCPGTFSSFTCCFMYHQDLFLLFQTTFIGIIHRPVLPGHPAAFNYFVLHFSNAGMSQHKLGVEVLSEHDHIINQNIHLSSL